MALDDDYADVISAALPAKPRQLRPQPSSSTYDPDTALPLISKYESGDRNIPNYRYDKGHTAQGHYQITNTNWRTKGPQAGVDLKQYPSAMAAPKEVQAKVAKLMYGERGFADWAPFNPRLKAAIGRGEQPTSQDPYDDVIKAAIPQKTKQQTKSADPYDDVINAAISGQTLPPQSKLKRVNQSQTPATNPRSSRQQSVPTAEQALQKIMDDMNRATGIPKPRTRPRQPQAPFIDRTIPNMQEMLTTPDTSPAGREREQVRQEVIADRAARRGTAASPTVKGLQRILSAPATSFAELARPEDENVSNETTERIEAMRAARRPEVQQLANDYRKQIRTSAAATNLGSGRGGQWTQELLAKATAGLSDYVAAGLRAVANPVLSPAGALLTDEDKAAKFADTVNTHALALQQAAEAEGADRNFASKLAQDAVAGAISSAPDMAAMMAGLPAPLAFGAGGATRALGRNQSPEQVANAAGTSALSAAPFEIPVGGTGLRGAIKRAGTVGAGTTALELAQGRTPSEALKGGLTNAIMSVGGGKKSEESSLNRGLDRIIEQEQARVSPSQEVNIPERPETVNAQLEAVQQGTRPAVLLTKGERSVQIPKGLTAVRTEAGMFYYDPKQISRETILQKVADGTHGEILGHVEPKSATTTEAVVARAPDGTEIQSSAVSPENVDKQVEVLQAQHPNAQIETGGEDLAKQVIAERVEAPQIPKEVLEARARIGQRGQNEAQLNPELQSGSGTNIPRVAEVPTETSTTPVAKTTPSVEAEPIAPPPPTETTQAAEEAPREPSTTAVKNASMEADRVAMDLPELAQAEPRKAPEVHRRAIEANTKDPRAVDRLTEQALNTDKNFTDVETAQVRLRAQEIKNRESELLKEIDATDDPAEIRDKRAELDSLTDEFDQLSQATKKAGTEWGRAGVARQQPIDQDFSLVAMRTRLKAAKGEKLSEKQNAAVEGLHKRIFALEADLEKANEKVSQKTLQRQIDRVVRQSRRGETRATLDDEFAALKTQFAKARAEVKGVQASGFAGLDPEGKLTKIVAKMAENRVKTGINEAGKLVDSIHDAISEHVDIDKRELRDLISGYGLTKELSQDQVKKSLRDMKSVMRLASALEDAEAKQKPLRSGLQRDVDTPEVKELRKQLNDKLREVGLTGPLPGPTLREGVGRTEGPRQSEARKLPMEGPRLSDARQVPMQGPRMSEARSSGVPLQGPKLSDVNKLPAEGPKITDAPFVGPRQSDVRRLPAEGPKITDAPKVGPKETLDTIRTRYAKQIAEYERRIREGDFSDRPAPRQVIDTPETAKMREDLLRTKNQYQRLLNQQRGGHQLRNISGIYKAWLLSGPLTHVKNIAGTGMYQVFDEGARVPAVIMDAMMSKVTGQRGLEGNSPSAMLAAVKQSLTVGAKEAKEIMKHGATREDLERHQYQEIDFGVNTGKRAIDQGVKAIELAHNVIFRFMSASDRVWYQGAYKRNLVDRARVQARNEGLKGEARVRRAQELIDNPSDQLAADAKHDALVSTFNNDNVLSTKIKGARGMASETKFAKGLTKKGRERLNAAENLALDFVLPFDRTPTNVVSRIVEGSPLGYLKNAGQLVKAAINRGMSAEDQRQFSQTFGRATAGTALIALGWKLADSIFDVDDKGNVVLKLGSHRIRLDYVSPVANLVSVGVKLRRNHDKEKGLGEDAKVIGRELTNIPLLRATNQITELGQDPARSAAKTGARYAFSAVPFNSAIRTAAQALDPKERKAKGFVQEIQKNIPILRERLPEDVNRRTQVVEPMVDKFRKGRLGEDELQTAVDKGTITEAEAKRIKQQGSMSLQEAEFHNIKDPQKALDTFTRMSATQRERVREIMERKAWSLLYSDSMEGSATEKERKRAKLQQQFDRLGLTPKASSTNRGGLRGAVQSAFA